MLKLAARARPCVALPGFKPPLLRPSFALANTFAVSTKHSSARFPRKSLQFFDENGKSIDSEVPKHCLETEMSEHLKSGKYMKMMDSTEEMSKYVKNAQFSEVATLDFVRSVLKLPVPDAKLWSNPDLGATHLRRAIIMDIPEGRTISSILKGSNSLADRMRVTHYGWQFEKKVSSITFDRYGSLYRPTSDFMYEVLGMEKAKVIHGVTPEEKQFIESEFYIGPSCEKRLIQGDGKPPVEGYHGPWASAIDYVESLLRGEIEILSKSLDQVDKHGTSYEVHIKLLRMALSIVPHIMPKDSEVTSPRLHHPVFGGDDVFYDDEYRIKTVTGWTGAWVGPSFAALSWALLFDPDHEIIKPEPLIEQLKSEVSGEEFDRLSQTMLERGSMLQKVRKEPVLPLVHYAIQTRRYGTFPLALLLMHIHSRWELFGGSKPCPYKVSDKRMTWANNKMDRMDAEGCDEELRQAVWAVSMWTIE